MNLYNLLCVIYSTAKVKIIKEGNIIFEGMNEDYESDNYDVISVKSENNVIIIAIEESDFADIESLQNLLI